MNRVRNRQWVINRFSRRRVLAMAATGVGASVAGVAGLSLAGESGSARRSGEARNDGAPLVLSLRDAKKGTFDVFSGGSRSTLTDKKLASRLLQAVNR